MLVLVEWDERNRFAQFLPSKKAHLTLTHYDLSSLQLPSRFKKICFTYFTNENIALLISESLLPPQPLPLLQRLLHCPYKPERLIRNIRISFGHKEELRRGGQILPNEQMKDRRL